jgi:4-coumarate--CoA ligase
MTESSPITLVTRNVSARPAESTPGSAGSIVLNTEGKIRDPATGKSLPPNQRGELCIRGPQVMKGGRFVLVEDDDKASCEVSESRRP